MSSFLRLVPKDSPICLTEKGINFNESLISIILSCVLIIIVYQFPLSEIEYLNVLFFISFSFIHSTLRGSSDNLIYACSNFNSVSKNDNQKEPSNFRL